MAALGVVTDGFSLHNGAQRRVLTPEDAAGAKYWATDLEGEVLDGCLQLFGGYGYMAEYPIGRMWRDARIQRIYGGANEIMKDIVGRGMLR